MIRSAKKCDSHILTEISFASKRYWGYPESFFEIWKDELTITAEYISSNHVVVIENEGEIVGYYSVVRLDEDLDMVGFTMECGIWLEHVFIKPEQIGRGYGRKLMQHLLDVAGTNGWENIKILSDPHATQFYTRLGAAHLKDVPSSIEGRNVAYLEWRTKGDA